MVNLNVKRLGFVLISVVRMHGWKNLGRRLTGEWGFAVLVGGINVIIPYHNNVCLAFKKCDLHLT